VASISCLYFLIPEKGSSMVLYGIGCKAALQVHGDRLI